MNMCTVHWTRLREAIASRGLSALVSDSGAKAASNLQRELTDGPSIDSYDPLMAAFTAIGSNGMTFIGQLGGNPLATLSPDAPEHMRCTICYLNWMMDEHDRLCTDERCEKPKGEAAHYEWMIDRAADEQVEVWKAMQP